MLTPRDYVFDKDARQKIFAGVKLMYDAVSSTLGPNGRMVLIDRNQVVQTTKDGVSVAEEVKAKDRWQEIGCKIIKEASQNTNLSAGDATTTAVVLAYEMCRLALDLPASANVLKVKRGMQLAVDAAVKHLENMAKKVSTREDYLKVAQIASQDEEIAKKCVEAFLAAGEFGSIEIERAEEPTIEIEKIEGLSFKKGWATPFCINNLQKRRAEAEDIPVLVTDKPIKHQKQLLPILEALQKQNIYKILIIADDFSGEALGMISANCQQRTFFVIPVRAPSFGNDKIAVLQDICAATGATFISEENTAMRVERANPQMLGLARKVIVNQEKTTILSEDNIEIKKRVSDRVDFVKSQLADAPEGSLDRDLIQTRLATLTDGICILKVGAQTEVERHEKKHRVEDAVRALKSASEEGVTAGCGVALLRCVKAIDEIKTTDPHEQTGIRIVKNALHSPALRVLEVADVEDRGFIVGQIKEMDDNTGYDFNTGGPGDMIELGIWDAKKAVRCALQNAAETAKTFISIGCAMSEIEPDTVQKLGEALKQG